jgi:CubicO group peptidase (beta-lactamase class C family)
MDLSALPVKLEDALRRHHVAGAGVAVYHAGDFKAASAGVLNVVTGVELTEDAVMHIGSIAKLFTATLVMQLVDEGLIKLDDLVRQHLPDLRLRDASSLDRITIKMLLNHTSGIDGDVQPDYGHDEETIEKAVKRLSDMRQIHDPGRDCSYCNGAFVIAGYLAQRLTGNSWYRLIKERIYRPLGMQHAVTLPEEALLYRASVGHHFDAKAERNVRTSFSLLPLSFAPGGTTLMMSATDLITFARAHLGNGLGSNGCRILSQESARAMRTLTARRGKSNESAGFGLGWIVFKHGVRGHGGGAPGVVSWVYIHPEKDFAAAVLTNSDCGGKLIEELTLPWLEEITGGGSLYDGEPKASQYGAGPIDPKAYTGTFENVLSRYVVSEISSGLGISTCFKFPLYDSSKTQMTPVMPLLPVGQDEFVFMPTANHAGALLGAANSVRVAFRTPDSYGRRQHLSIPEGRPEGRVYRRVDG